MSKIICEVCGTAYQDTATQCPICGTVRPGDAVAAPSAEEKSGGYQYVKGGRFSKANVRKRNKAMQSAQPEPVMDSDAGEEKPKSNRGLVITAILLVLAIIAVLIYIVVHFLGNWLLPDSGKPNKPQDQTTGTTEAVLVPCTAITLDTSVVELTKVGASAMIYPTAEPADTTDMVFYNSENPEVATVSDTGKITAVGAGQTVITITCGDVTVQCRVICEIETTVETTVPETTEVPTAPADFRLNREDITFSAKGETWLLYNGELDVKDITWTSDDETIAKITNGKVEAVGSGITNVHGEYAGAKVSCVIRCSFEDDGPIQGSGGNITEGGGTTTGGTVTISHEDVTLELNKAGWDNFVLTLKDAQGNTANVTWTVGNSSVCTVDGNRVTAVGVGTTEVTATYNNQTYKCIVRVTEAG